MRESCLSFERHQLRIQLTKEAVGCVEAAGDGQHVLLAQIHSFRRTALGPLGVVPVLQGLVLPAGRPGLSGHGLALSRALGRETP